jgi:hypothetical protein
VALIALQQLDDSIAEDVLLRYLTEGSGSPVVREFVECEQPIASAVTTDQGTMLVVCPSLR